MSPETNPSILMERDETKPRSADAPDDLAGLLAEFRAGERFLVTSHARPDGDAVGSVLAMGALLEQMGCTVEMALADPVPYVYEKLPGAARIRIGESVGDCATTAVLLECDGIERTGLKGLEGRRLINIDHHASGRNYADVNWIDEQACAVAAMVYRLAVAAEAEITPAMATCLYTAVLTDTGSFHYPGPGPEAFELARDLVALGANATQIAQQIFASNREAKVRLLGAALQHMRREGALAWSWASAEDMAVNGASAEDCEGVVNCLISIEGVEAAAFLREIPGENQFRMSLRGKGRVDVAWVAAQFGGGGHRNASGCTIDGPLDTALARVLHALRECSGL